MLIAVCPDCGERIPIPDTKPRSIICDKCGKQFDLDYQKRQTEKLSVKIKSACETVKNKVVQFKDNHPKIVKAAAAIGGATLLVVAAKVISDNKGDDTEKLYSSNSLENTSDDLPNTPVEIEMDSDSSLQEETETTDWDILSFLGEHCYNCGADLSGGIYVSPWEDGSNEYGYWVCPNCRAINTDWNSSDD